MKKLKNLWKNYKAPTPAKWRKVGDALLAVSIFLGSSELAIPNMPKWLPIVTVVLGVAGKFLTNFFAADDGGKAE